ncbi:MAG: ArsR family transcriptional regulator [Vulcanisaeta sp.]
MDVVVKPEIIVTLNGRESQLIPGYDSEYVLMRSSDFNTALNDEDLSIILTIIRGSTKFTQIMNETKMPRGKLARHLTRLMKAGWIIKNGNRYLPSGRIYVVYDIHNVDSSIGIDISMTKGAFIDPIHGLVIVNGEPLHNYCAACPLRQVCVGNVKSLAHKYGIKLRGAEPSEAYVELFRELVRRDLIKKLKSGWKIVIRK